MIVVGAGGLMRSGTVNDLATPTSTGRSAGYILGMCWSEGNEECIASYVGDEASGVGLECCSR